MPRADNATRRKHLLAARPESGSLSRYGGVAVTISV
jgi:hypothetical protein